MLTFSFIIFPFVLTKHQDSKHQDCGSKDFVEFLFPKNFENWKIADCRDLQTKLKNMNKTGDNPKSIDFAFDVMLY
jgi:hypothetical protein